MLGVIKPKKIHLYTPMIRLYQRYGLSLRAVHELVEYEQGNPFEWFPEEIANTRYKAFKDPLKNQLGDVMKLKGNTFYGKMIEDLVHLKRAKFIQVNGLLTMP